MSASNNQIGRKPNMKPLIHLLILVSCLASLSIQSYVEPTVKTSSLDSIQGSLNAAAVKWPGLKWEHPNSSSKIRLHRRGAVKNGLKRFWKGFKNVGKDILKLASVLPLYIFAAVTMWSTLSLVLWILTVLELTILTLGAALGVGAIGILVTSAALTLAFYYSGKPDFKTQLSDNNAAGNATQKAALGRVANADTKWHAINNEPWEQFMAPQHKAVCLHRRGAVKNGLNGFKGFGKEVFKMARSISLGLIAGVGLLSAITDVQALYLAAFGIEYLKFWAAASTLGSAATGIIVASTAIAFSIWLARKDDAAASSCRSHISDGKDTGSGRKKLTTVRRVPAIVSCLPKAKEEIQPEEKELVSISPSPANPISD